MTIQVSIRLEPEVLKKIKEIKKEEGRSYNGAIKAMLKEYQKAKKNN